MKRFLPRFWLSGIFCLGWLTAAAQAESPRVGSLIGETTRISSDAKRALNTQHLTSGRVVSLPEQTLLLIPLQRKGAVLTRRVNPTLWVVDLPQNRLTTKLRNLRKRNVVELIHTVPRHGGVALEITLGPDAGVPSFEIETEAGATLVIRIPVKKKNQKATAWKNIEDVVSSDSESAASSSAKSSLQPLGESIVVSVGEEPAKPEPTLSVPEPLTVPDESAKRRVKRIVIDPGHGGKDPGAIGRLGTQEKELNLIFAQDVADAFRALDYEVLLTRLDDRFIPLEERAQLANRYRADLFLSIHCNASLSSQRRGFEVYFLSETASDPQAAAVARLENAPLALEGKNPTGSVQSILRSLERNQHINQSSRVGSLIDESVGRYLSQEHLGVKQAAFYVLRGAQMPALLIEMGFMTNRADEKALTTLDFRQRMVRAIVEAIERYNGPGRSR